MPERFQRVAGGLRLRLKVAPKARRSAVSGWLDDPDGSKVLKLSVTAAPEAGRANEAVTELLASEWGVAKSAISVVSGATDRRKVVEIRGPQEELLAKLSAWLRRHTI